MKNWSETGGSADFDIVTTGIFDCDGGIPRELEEFPGVEYYEVTSLSFGNPSAFTNVGRTGGKPRMARSIGWTVYTVTLLDETSVSVSGDLDDGCPGVVNFSIADASPDSTVLLVGSGALGDSEVPGGVCIGFDLELQDPLVLGSVDVDENGTATLDRTIPANACSSYVQAIDLATCEVSSPVLIE